MEEAQVVIVDQKDIVKPFGEYPGNLTSHLIKHPDLISKEAKFVQVEFGISDWKRLQATSAPLRLDLVFEDEHNIYLVEVKDDPSQLEDGKRQIVEYGRVFRGFLEMIRVSVTKRIVPMVATVSQES